MFIVIITFVLSLTANTDNTFGAIGFVSRLIPSIYPISIIRVNPETCEPIRNEEGLCMRCNPGTTECFKNHATHNIKIVF